MPFDFATPWPPPKPNKRSGAISSRRKILATVSAGIGTGAAFTGTIASFLQQGTVVTYSALVALLAIATCQILLKWRIK